MAWALNGVYVLLWLAAAPWLLWRRWRWGKNRRGWLQKWWGLGAVPAASGPRIWLHAVSVGEVNLLAPIMAELSRRGRFEFAISTTTETGFELARQKYPEQLVFFCPFDFSWAVKRTLQHLQPQLIVLAELELWPNWLRCAARAGIPVVVVNGRLSAKSFAGYRTWRPLVSGMFRRLGLVLAQSEEYAQRFIALGTPAERVVVAGNVKFDNVDPERGRIQAAGFAGQFDLQLGQPLLVGGSTQPDEELMLLRAFGKLRATFPELKLALVPRHPEKISALEAELRQSPWSYRFRSGRSERVGNSTVDVIVVDVIGELAAWWTLATVAYVGGSLGSRGGQNMIEPAACGCVVCFGPNTRNFKDVVELLLAHDAASVIANEADWIALVSRTLKEPDWARQRGQRAAELVANHRGAASRTADELLRQLPKIADRPSRDASFRAA
jgi:3-deoxy-D-manno-octulosonic-acid transferase